MIRLLTMHLAVDCFIHLGFDNRVWKQPKVSDMQCGILGTGAGELLTNAFRVHLLSFGGRYSEYGVVFGKLGIGFPREMSGA